MCFNLYGADIPPVVQLNLNLKLKCDQIITWLVRVVKLSMIINTGSMGLEFK